MQKIKQNLIVKAHDLIAYSIDYATIATVSWHY